MDPVTTAPVLPATASPTAKSVQVPAPPAVKRPLISDSLRHPAWLWLASVAPLTLLFLSAQYSYSLVSSDFSPDERWASLGQAAALLALIAIPSAMALRGIRSARVLSPAEAGVTLLVSIAAMVLGLTFTCHTIPWEVPDWMVSRDELLYRAFCLAMPGAFYALLLLSSSPVRRSVRREFGKALLIGNGSVVGTFLFTYMAGRIDYGFQMPEWVGETLIFTLIFAGGSMLSASVIRITLLSYLGVRALPFHRQQGFMFLVAVVGPLCGLWLNAYIPFPNDFQAPVIYILSVANGLLLMLPVVRSIAWHRVIWLAQCVMFPFSAYFFVVFLPWLPASPFALIVIGAGFLILVPLVLGLVHGYRVIDGYREEIRDGKKWKPALAGLAAVLVLPTAIIGNMWQDRETLDQALDYVYAPDYRKDITFPGDLNRLQNSLQHLVDAKHGIYLPFLTPLYNQIVFHNLVLPDAKIERLQQTFFGTAPTTKASFMLRSALEDEPWQPNVIRPNPAAVLDDCQVASTAQGAVTTSRLTLVMRNPDDTQSEYVTTIKLPEGVYVSDFGLYMNNDLVPARIVEKKTAMWVYEKISVVENRDPGMLIYKSRNELELHVFPFAAGETRRAVIELVHANTGPLSVSIGDRIVALTGGFAPPSAVITSCATPSGSMALAEGNLAGFELQRKPYLHVLIDCSKGSSYTADSLSASLREAEAAFPDAATATITAINYEARDIVPGLTPVAQLDAGAIQKDLLPSRGGLLEDRFLKRGFCRPTTKCRKARRRPCSGRSSSLFPRRLPPRSAMAAWPISCGSRPMRTSSTRRKPGPPREKKSPGPTPRRAASCSGIGPGTMPSAPPARALWRPSPATSPRPARRNYTNRHRTSSSRRKATSRSIPPRATPMACAPGPRRTRPT